MSLESDPLYAELVATMVFESNLFWSPCLFVCLFVTFQILVLALHQCIWRVWPIALHLSRGKGKGRAPEVSPCQPQTPKTGELKPNEPALHLQLAMFSI